ncbi:hypothetical protein RR46_01661 [Papilio xuthus]|uniref:Uncharacterized protein n=1 Tax=Papilio xuthus TaxID=66420 RepID=A0A0N1I5Y2_PAPXU|nr:hypothetical protein RR46_01661 [Papilio xuthus]
MCCPLYSTKHTSIPHGVESELTKTYRLRHRSCSQLLNVNENGSENYTAKTIPC